MKRLKMKALEQATGVSRETIRYYIREGLLPEPERPSRNVAWYDESFVERIGLIKELQNKRFLPLQVIKAILDSDSPRTADEIDALTSLDGRLFAEATASAGESQRLCAVAERCGLETENVEKLGEFGVIEIEEREGERWLSATAVEITEQWARLRSAGFTEELGFGPESLRLYVDFIELLIGEELRVFAKGISGRVAAEVSVRMGEEGIDSVNQMITLMRKAAILRSIREVGLPDAGQRRTGSD